MSYVSAKRASNSVFLSLKHERLDAANAADVKSEILAAMGGASVSRLVIDLEVVNFIDSSGLGALVSVRKNIPDDCEMELQNPTEFVDKVLHLTKMDRVFTF